MKFRLIEAERAHHSVSRLSRRAGRDPRRLLCLEAAPGLAARAARPGALRADRQGVHRLAETYGAPRIRAELENGHGLRISRKRVARLMRRLGIEGVSRRGKRPVTTKRAEPAPAASDLLRRRFQAPGPDRLWVADITYVPTWEGYLFLAAVLDAWSRRGVGWSMRDDLKAELVVDALGMAVTRRRPTRGLIHHSDRGSQPRTQRRQDPPRRRSAGERRPPRRRLRHSIENVVSGVVGFGLTLAYDLAVAPSGGVHWR
jgi:putative transposase